MTEPYSGILQRTHTSIYQCPGPLESESDSTSFYTQTVTAPALDGSSFVGLFLYKANAEETVTSLGSFRDNIENQPGQVRH